MKIKQVKIQAFKSYLEEKDGIFDFSHGNENDVANIVSIYAPNGFGKTSFYDAVDFCITNNVTRYIRDDKVRVKNDKLSKKGSYILRNSKASKSLDTKVDVFTSDNQVFNKVLKRNNSNHRDYLFRDSDTPENKKYFRDLMLSQENKVLKKLIFGNTLNRKRIPFESCFIKSSLNSSLSTFVYLSRP